MNKEQIVSSTPTPPLSQTAVKCRVFAQYWGQRVMHVGGVGLVEIGTGGWNLKHPDFFLELKPLSKITDEDYKHIVCQISGVSDENFNKLNNEINKNKTINILKNFEETDQRVLDYLRSKGYAVPFMEFSVDELVNLGWVRLV